MGDNLPELLYRAFCNAAGLVYGSDETPGFNNLSTTQRYAWEQVAVQARTELNLQFRGDMRAASEELGAEQAIANLLEVEGG
jgi:hypothetical protein